jgi:hypothetical protein
MGVIYQGRLVEYLITIILISLYFFSYLSIFVLSSNKLIESKIYLRSKLVALSTFFTLAEMYKDQLLPPTFFLKDILVLFLFIFTIKQVLKLRFWESTVIVLIAKVFAEVVVIVGYLILGVAGFPIK